MTLAMSHPLDGGSTVLLWITPASDTLATECAQNLLPEVLMPVVSQPVGRAWAEDAAEAGPHPVAASDLAETEEVLALEGRHDQQNGAHSSYLRWS